MGSSAAGAPCICSAFICAAIMEADTVMHAVWVSRGTAPASMSAPPVIFGAARREVVRDLQASKKRRRTKKRGSARRSMVRSRPALPGPKHNIK